MSAQKENIHISQPGELVHVEEEIEIDLVELVYYFRSKLVTIIVTFLIGALGAGMITYFFVTPKYEAASKLYMVSASSDSVVDLTDLNLGTSLSSDYEQLLKIRPIFEEILEEEKLNYTYEELLEMVTMETLEDTRILTITVESIVPGEAQEIANDLAEKAVTYLPELMETSAPNIAEHAIYPESPSSPNLVKNTAIGAALGLMSALGLLTVFFVMDDTVKSAEDVEKAFGIMPLTVIPEGEMESISDKTEKEILRQKRRRRRKIRRKLFWRKPRKGNKA